MGQFGSKGGLKKVVPLKKKKNNSKPGDNRTPFNIPPPKKVDPLIARIADLETMNDTLFKRTSELAQSIVTIVDTLTTIIADVVAVKTLLEIE